MRVGADVEACGHVTFDSVVGAGCAARGVVRRVSSFAHRAKDRVCELVIVVNDWLHFGHRSIGRCRCQPTTSAASTRSKILTTLGVRSGICKLMEALHPMQKHFTSSWSNGARTPLIKRRQLGQGKLTLAMLAGGAVMAIPAKGTVCSLVADAIPGLDVFSELADCPMVSRPSL